MIRRIELGSKLGPIGPKHQGKPTSTRYQKTRPANKIHNRAESAKPPSPVQIRAAPPIPSFAYRSDDGPARAKRTWVFTYRSKRPPVLQQITFGASEEEGLAMAPDGRSLITAVGDGTSTVDSRRQRRSTSIGGRAGILPAILE